MQTPRSRGGSSRAELGVFGLQAADPLVLTVSGSRARQTSSSTPQPVRVVVGLGPAPERVVVGEGVPQARAAPRDAGPAGSRPHHGPCGSGGRLGRPKNVPLPRVEPPPRPRHPTRGQQLPLAQKFREAPLPQVRAGGFSILCSAPPAQAARQKAPARMQVLPSVWHPPSALGGAPPPPRGVHASLCTCPLWGATADLRAAPLGGRPRHARGGSRRRRSAVLNAVTRA